MKPQRDNPQRGGAGCAGGATSRLAVFGKLVDRSVLRDLTIPFLLAAFALLLVLMTHQMLRLMDWVINRGASAGLILGVLWALLPSLLVIALPIAGLIASVTAFNRMAADRELLAWLASGAPWFRLLRPVLLFGSLVTLVIALLSFYSPPWSGRSLKDLSRAAVQEQLRMGLDEGRFIPLGDLILYVEKIANGTQLQNVFISDRTQATRPRLIVARAGSIGPGPDATIEIDLRVGTLHTTVMPGDPSETSIPLAFGSTVSPPARAEPGTRSDLSQDSYIARLRLDGDATPEGSSASTEQLMIFDRYRMRLPVHLDTGVEEPPSVEQLRTAIQERGPLPELLRPLADHYKNTSFPVSALILSLLGAPLGVLSQRTGRMGGFAIGIMIVVGYYALTVESEFLMLSGWIGPMASAWLPNAVLAAATLFLTLRAR